LGETIVFKYLSSIVKCSGSILGLYCLSLAIAPIGYAGEYNPTPGAFSSAKDESAIEGGKASDNKGGDSYRPNPNRLANLRAAQLQAQLEADRNAYLTASNRVKQVQSKRPQPNPNYSILSRNNHPNPAFTSTANNSSSELASAKAAQTQAAINLSETQRRVSLFLKSFKSKRNVVLTRMISH
jgi:multidrug efflux pump subunit AcrA (membrane-fusion protein)